MTTKSEHRMLNNSYKLDGTWRAAVDSDASACVIHDLDIWPFDPKI